MFFLSVQVTLASGCLRCVVSILAWEHFNVYWMTSELLPGSDNFLWGTTTPPYFLVSFNLRVPLKGLGHEIEFTYMDKNE